MTGEDQIRVFEPVLAEFETEEELTVIVGYLPFINKGDSLKLVGNFINHPDYGRQFKIQTFEKIMPETLEALEKYLSGGIIKGVGPATAKRIVDKFGEETIPVLKFEPERLAHIRGISLNKAQEISDEFNEKWDLWQIVGFLERFGITGQNCKKVYEKLGDCKALVRGVHMSCSLSGAYQRSLSHQVPEKLDMETIWKHIGNIDQHKAFQTEAAKRILETIQPEYVVHEVGYDSMKDLCEQLPIQLRACK